MFTDTRRKIEGENISAYNVSKKLEILYRKINNRQTKVYLTSR
jgi:hypothetical protein